MIRIPPDGPSKLRRIRAEALQLARSIHACNQKRTDEVPLDIGPELVIVRICDRGLQAAEAGDGNAYSRIAAELVEAAERAVQI